MFKLPRTTGAKRHLLAAVILAGGIGIGGCSTFNDAHGQQQKQVPLPSTAGTPLKFSCEDNLTIPAITKDLYDRKFAYQEQELGDCYASYNLNNKGKDEILVLLTGAFYGGSGGSQLYIYSRDNGPWEMLADGTQLTFLNSVVVSSDVSNGFSTLNLRAGDSDRIAVRMQYDGKKYQSLVP